MLLYVQREALHKSFSSSSSSAQDWQDATSVARAFNIGRAESLAVSNLQERVSDCMKHELREACRVRGMRQFLTHEAVSRDVFNRGWRSGQSNFGAWGAELMNDSDDVLVSWPH